jgi:hypothetical protein
MEDNVRTADFFCCIISNLLNKPKQTSRLMPIGLNYSVNCNEKLDIYLPNNDWDLKEVNQEINCPSFSFIKKSTAYFNHIIINYNYERHKDNVMPNEVAQYIQYFTMNQCV